MRRLYAAALAATLFVLLPAVRAHAGPPPPAATPATAGWPATRAGELARGWVNAFSAGEDSMRRFIDRNLAPKSLEERNTNTRVEKYKTLRDQYGKLQLDAVLKSTPEELTARLIDADAKSHEFVFAVQKEAPYKLVSVSIREQVHGMHGMFGGFHH